MFIYMVENGGNLLVGAIIKERQIRDDSFSFAQFNEIFLIIAYIIYKVDCSNLLLWNFVGFGLLNLYM